MTDSIIREFVREQRELLELELNSEQDQAGIDEDATSSHRTVALRQLEASDISVGLYGRTVVQLTAIPNDAKSGGASSGGAAPLLPAHRFTVGDDVEIHSKNDKKSNAKGGVISAVSDTFISVALFQKNNTGGGKNNNNAKSNNEEEESEEDALVGSPPLTLIPKSNVEVHRKLIAGLTELERHGPNHPIAGHLVEALFSSSSQQMPQPQIPPQASEQEQPYNDNLDSSQLEAISFALQEGRPVALIHGPPGTGE